MAKITRVKLMRNMEYYNWLMTRSFKGLLYRNFYLYPKIKRHVKFPAADIGCGIGDFLKFCGKNIIGYDINKDCVNFCKSKKLNAVLMKINIVPANNKCFNSVILDNVLEHIIDPIPLLNECNRVLNINGKIIIGVPGNRGYLADVDHKINYSDKDIVKLIEKLNFLLDYSFYTPFKSSYLNNNLSQYCRYFVFTKKE